MGIWVASRFFLLCTVLLWIFMCTHILPPPPPHTHTSVAMGWAHSLIAGVGLLGPKVRACLTSESKAPRIIHLHSHPRCIKHVDSLVLRDLASSGLISADSKGITATSLSQFASPWPPTLLSTSSVYTDGLRIHILFHEKPVHSHHFFYWVVWDILTDYSF